MSSIDKFFAKVLGYDSSVLMNHSPMSRRKVTAMGASVLIPSVIYFCVGFTLVKYNTEGSILVSLLAGFIFSFIIFLTDRSLVIMPMNKSKLNYAFRGILALTMSIVGAMVLDVVMFSQSIENYQHNQQISLLEHEVEDYYIEYKKSEQIFHCEINGCSGGFHHDLFKNGCPSSTGFKGVGKASIKKENSMNLAQADYLSAKQKYNEYINGHSHELTFGFLDNLKALWMLKNEDRAIMVWTIVIFILTLGLEVNFLVLKMNSTQTSFEKAEEIYELIRKEEFEHARSRIKSNKYRSLLNEQPNFN